MAKSDCGRNCCCEAASKAGLLRERRLQGQLGKTAVHAVLEQWVLPCQPLWLQLALPLVDGDYSGEKTIIRKPHWLLYFYGTLGRKEAQVRACWAASLLQ